jgi:hypothetical protein
MTLCDILLMPLDGQFHHYLDLWRLDLVTDDWDRCESKGRGAASRRPYWHSSSPHFSFIRRIPVGTTHASAE